MISGGGLRDSVSETSRHECRRSTWKDSAVVISCNFSLVKGEVSSGEGAAEMTE